MALVTPFLLLLLFGVSEMGLAWVSGNRLEGSVSTAARVGSSSGSTVDADRNILLSLRASLPAKLRANVTRVVVYRSSPSGAIHADCLTRTPGGFGVTNECNIYSASQLASITATTNLGTTDDAWPASGRRDHLSGPPDWIGVLVMTRHDAVTDTFWSGFDIERSSVYRIQPDIDG
jgi:Flp pilus assembly protein TadG